MYVDQAFNKSATLTTSGPTADAVRQQLEHMCRSEGFAGSERLKCFLRFIVEETLEGRGDRLKAYTVALSVFGREETFDAQADPIVRIEAGRLRRAIEHHYLTDGRDDPVLITVPKGRYLPRFEWRTVKADAGLVETAGLRSPRHADETETAGLAPRDVRPKSFGRMWRWAAACGLAIAVAGALLALAGRDGETRPPGPVLLVLPFTSSGDTIEGAVIASDLTSVLIDGLSGRVSVLGQETTRLSQADFSLSALRRGYGLTHVLEGDVASKDGLSTISVRLVDAGTHAIVWGKRYHRVSRASLADVEAEIGGDLLFTLNGKSAVLANDRGQERTAAPHDRRGFVALLQRVGAPTD